MTTTRAPVAARQELRPFHWLVTLLAGLAFTSNGLTLGALSFALPGIQAEWGLGAAQAGLLVLAIGLGQMVGAVVIGGLSDHWGRRLAFAITVGTSGIAIGAAALAPGPEWLAAGLFVAGIGFGGVAPVAASLVSEFAPAHARGRLLAWTQVLWVAGWCLAGLGGALWLGSLGWRPIFGLGVLSLVLAIVSLRLVPESPLFLLARNRSVEARALVEALRRTHGVSLELPEQASPRPRRSVLERLSDLWSPIHRRRTATVWLVWLVMVATYSGPVVWLPTLLTMVGQSIEAASRTALLIALAQLPGTLMAVALIDRVGRRPLMLVGLGMCAVGTVALALARSEPLAIVGGVAVSAGIQAAWPVILAYASELYPTHMRSTGAGWASAAGRTGAVIGPGGLTLMLGAWGLGQELALGAFALALLAAMLVIVLLAEETAGRTLEQLSG